MLAIHSVRNNNPGNLRIGQPWQGLMPLSEMNADQRAEKAFCVFREPKWGFRALAILLRNDGHVFGPALSVRKIIDRFAPPNENDTQAYILAVAHEVGLDPDAYADTSKREIVFPLCKAIARHETGSWEPYWSDDMLNAGLDLAGF